jgi:hypothetical protein
VRIFYLLFLLISILNAGLNAQNSCGNIFTDPGGIAGNYSGNTLFTDTLQSPVGQAIEISFTEFNLDINDTLFLYDPYFYQETVIALTIESGPATFTSVSPLTVWILNASGSNGAEGWIAELNCIDTNYLEILSDTLCAGFEGFLPWEKNLPAFPAIMIEAELCSSPAFDTELIALGENELTADSFYLQTSAYLEEGLYYLRLSAEDSTWSFLESVQVLYVKGLPAIPVISGDPAFCEGDTVELSIETQIRTDYIWYFDGTELLGSVNELRQVHQAGIYTVSAGNSCGTVLSETFQLESFTLPDPAILSSMDSLVCPGNPLEISILNTDEIAEEAWFNGDLQIAGDTEIIQISDEALIYVTRSNLCGVVVSDSLEIGAPGIPPQAEIALPGGSTFCEGSSVVLQAEIPEQYEYQWTLNGSPIDGGPTIEAFEEGVYSLTLMNACGMSNSLNEPELLVIPLPQPAELVAAGPTELCEGESVLVVADIEAGETYQWFVNGTPLQNNSLQLSVIESGNYSITTNTDCGIIESQNIIAVTVNPLPETPVIFEVGNPALCNGSSVELFVTPQSGVNFTWRKNNSLFGSTNSIITTEPGVYTVSASNSCGTIQGLSPVPVTSGNPPQVPVIQAMGPLSFCEGLSVNLQTSPQNGVIYTWQLNGAPLPLNNFSLPATNTGVYTLQVSNACDTVVSSNSITVTVNPLPPAYQISPGIEQNLCEGESVTLSITPTPGVSYQWKNNGMPVGQNQASITVSTEGEYSLTLANTCGTTPALNTVIVNVDSAGPAQPQIIAQPGTALCPGGYVLLNAPPVPFQQYTWMLNGEIIENQAGAVLQAVEWGEYTVMASNACGISDISTGIELGPGDAPTDFEIYTSEGLEVCSNDSLAITAQVSFGVGLRWYRDGVLFEEGPAQIYVNEAGIYTAEGWNGCGEAVSLNQLVVDVLPSPPVPVIELQNGQLITDAEDAIQWYNSALEPLAGETGSSFIPLPVNASYYVSSTNEFGCTTLSSPFNYIVNALESLRQEHFQVYPNPAASRVNILAKRGETIVLSDTRGRVLQKLEAEDAFNGEELRMDVSAYAPGIYMLSNGHCTIPLVIMQP